MHPFRRTACLLIGSLLLLGALWLLIEQIQYLSLVGFDEFMTGSLRGRYFGLMGCFMLFLGGGTLLRSGVTGR